MGSFEDARSAFQRGDSTLAARLYRPLAETGDSNAQLQLGVMYDVGQGVTQNYEESVKWYRLAAEQGHAGAQYSLGLKYYYGEGVPQNYMQAFMWWNLTADAGDEWDKDMKEKAYDLRFALEQIMTPAQITEAQRLASEWKMNQGKQ